MRPDLFPVPGPWRGELAVITRPRGGDWLDSEVSGWRQAGLDLVVSLLEPDEAAGLGLSRESMAAEMTGIQAISFPIPDRDVPASIPATFGLLKKITDALDSGKRVAVHCRQGIGRSGLIAVATLAMSGVHVDDAIETVSKARGLRVPETSAQLRWLEAFHAGIPVESP